MITFSLRGLIGTLGILFFVAGNCLAQVPNQIGTFDVLSATSVVSKLLGEHIFDPAVLSTPQYREVERQMRDLAAQTTDREKWVKGFNAIWKDGPVSHVTLTASRQSAEDIASSLDTLRVGPKAVKLDWQERIAILTINTMMGQDTIEAIDKAFESLQSRQPDALVVDLRSNKGGAFAVRPLVGHLLTTDYDAGYFLSRSWSTQHSELPSRSAVTTLKPWTGWSIKSFWREVQIQPITRIRFAPETPSFTGKVFILTSSKTASAAEMAVDALLSLENVLIVGEQTAGQMLSQKIFDLTYGLQLSLPIADYYSHRTGRIEGKGIIPTVAVPAKQALEVALSMAQKTRSNPLLLNN